MHISALNSENVRTNMSVAGALMIEHRLIERMIRILDREAAAAKNTGNMTPGLLDTAIDFFKTYADLRHHGKEERVLFSELGRKKLPAEYKTALRELAKEHAAGRELVAGLVSSIGQYKARDPGALARIIDSLQVLCRSYRAHIEKEDRHFLIPVMTYFTKEEEAQMLERFREFDAGVPEENYRSAVEHFE